MGVNRFLAILELTFQVRQMGNLKKRKHDKDKKKYEMCQIVKNTVEKNK